MFLPTLYLRLITAIAFYFAIECKIGAAIRLLCTDQRHGIGGSISGRIADIDFVHGGILLS